MERLKPAPNLHVVTVVVTMAAIVLALTPSQLAQSSLVSPLRDNHSPSTAIIYESSSINALPSSVGNVSTYSDPSLSSPSTAFVAGSIVYVKGEGWPPKTNITLSFLFSSQGNYPVTIASWTVQTNDNGSFTGSLKLAANGPAGIWRIDAELNPSAVSSSTFAVYLPRSSPDLLIPGLLASGLTVAALAVFLWSRRRADRSNYYSAKRHLSTWILL